MFPKKRGGPIYTTQSYIFLIMGTPKTLHPKPITLGNPHVPLLPCNFPCLCRLQGKLAGGRKDHGPRAHALLRETPGFQK